VIRIEVELSKGKLEIIFDINNFEKNIEKIKIILIINKCFI